MTISVPVKFALPWGANASSTYIRSIPTNSQIGIQNGAASFNDGFPPLCFTPEEAGGTPPFGADFNGIFNELTANVQWMQAGGVWTFDSGFSTNIAGYPIGATLTSSIVPGRVWLNTVSGNTASPDVYPFTGWVTPPGDNPPGTPVPSFSATVLPGHVLANGQTIGNAGSGGTTAPTGLASATAFFLFCVIWQQFSQTTCPVQFNGATVTRGANPNADWVAGRVIQLPQMGGTGIIGQDTTTTNLTGVPVTSGSTTTPASLVGENLHTLTAAQIPAINSSGGSGFSASGNNLITVANGQNVALILSTTGLGSGGFTIFTVTQAGTLTSTGNNTINVSGAVTINSTSTNTSGQSHNDVQLSWTVAWNLAL